MREKSTTNRAATSQEKIDALPLALAQYKKLVEHAPVMIWRSTTNMACDYFNQGWLAFTGRAIEQELGEGWTENVHPEDLEGCLRTYREAFAKRQVFEMECRLRRHDGVYRWVFDRGVPFNDASGKFAGYIGSCIDVTDKFAMQAELRESEARYRTLIERMPDGVYRSTPAGKFVEVNPALVKMLGYSSREELLAIDIPKQLYFDSQERDAINAELLATGKNEIVAFRLRRKDGSELWIEDHGQIICDKQGQPKFYEGILRDLSERKKAQDQLREKEHHIRLLTEQMPAILWAVDVNLRFTHSTGAGLKDLGLKPGQVVGMSLFEYFQTSDRQHTAISNHQRALAGEQRTYEFAFKGHHYACVVEPLHNHEGKIIGVIGLANDITARQRAEEALRESEEKFRHLANTPLVGVYIIQDGVFAYVNDCLAGLFGYRPEELIGKVNHLALTHPDDRELSGTLMRRRLLGEVESAHYTFRGLRRDGTSFHCEVLGSRTQFRGRPAVQGVLLDITDRKRTEEALLRAQKLESLGVLAGGLAHDFNNLLVGVLGNASLALADLPADSSLRLPLESIAEAAHRAADLTQQMLAYSGKGHFQLRVLNINDLIRDFVRLVEASISKKVALHLRLADNLPNIEADPGQIQQVVMNLILNAAEAIGDHVGTVTIATGVHPLSGDDFGDLLVSKEILPGRFVVLEVTDTGSGMDEATLTKIFDPFFSTKFTGRGLGLSAVLGIVRGHQGAIKVDSHPGSGTIFKVFFPASAKLAEPVAQPEFIHWHGKGLVLIIDDEHVVRHTAQIALQRLGYQVLVAENGRQGIDLFREHASEIQLVMLDMTMPEISGEQAFRELRRLQPQVRVLLSSGYDEIEATQRIKGEGLSGFIQKPYTIATLAQKVKEILST